MTPRGFDRYFLRLGAGSHPKFATLTDSERCAHFLGVLALAAASPTRGCLLVGDLPAAPAHVAAAAGVTKAVAASALRKLEAIGVLYHDEERECLRVHDWDDVNPPPKVDATAAERQRRYRLSGKREPIPNAVKDQVMARDLGQCVHCGSEGDLHYHHRVSVAEGGTNDPDNLEMLCIPCHRDRHANVTPKSRRDIRDGDGSVAPPEVEVEEQKTKKNVNSTVEQGSTGPARLVFDAWLESTGKTTRTVLDAKRRGIIQRALKHYPVADLIDAVRGWKHSAHHRGENAQGTVYNDLGLLLRDAEHIEKFRDLERGVGRPNGAGISSLDQKRLEGLHRLITQRGAA